MERGKAGTQYSSTPSIPDPNKEDKMQGTMKAARIYGFEKTSKST